MLSLYDEFFTSEKYYLKDIGQQDCADERDEKVNNLCDDGAQIDEFNHMPREPSEQKFSLFYSVKNDHCDR